MHRPSWTLLFVADKSLLPPFLASPHTQRGVLFFKIKFLTLLNSNFTNVTFFLKLYFDNGFKNYKSKNLIKLRAIIKTNFYKGGKRGEIFKFKAFLQGACIFVASLFYPACCSLL